MKISLQVIVDFPEALLAENDDFTPEELAAGSHKALQTLLNGSFMDTAADSYFHDEGLPGPDSLAVLPSFPQWTIASGNLADGYELYGLFPSEEAAAMHANTDPDLPDQFSILKVNSVPEAGDPDEEKSGGSDQDQPVTCQACKTKVYPADPFYGSSCGTFCTPHMLAHAQACGVCNWALRKHFPELKVADYQETKHVSTEGETRGTNDR